MDLDKIINGYQAFVKDRKPDEVAGEKDSTLNKVRNVSALANLLGDIVVAYDMVKDSVTGKYTGIPKSTIAMVAGGLAYLALPIDLVPDFIPVAGWLDDAAVLGWIFSQCATEISRYKAHRSSTTPTRA